MSLCLLSWVVSGGLVAAAPVGDGPATRIPLLVGPDDLAPADRCLIEEAFVDSWPHS